MARKGSNEVPAVTVEVNLPPWLQRVLDERDALADKHKALAQSLAVHSPAMGRQFTLLQRQESLMAEYLSVLNERIGIALQLDSITPTAP